MAKKNSPVVSSAIKPAAPVAKTSTEVRNTPIPKISAPLQAKKEVTQDMIARRAYEISCSGGCGSELENWFRAERELKGL